MGQCHHPPPSILLFSHFSTTSHPFPHLHRECAFVNRLALYQRHDSTFEAFAPECFAQCSLWRWPLPGSATWYPGHPRVLTVLRPNMSERDVCSSSLGIFPFYPFHFCHQACKWFWVFSGFCLSLQGKNAFWDIPDNNVNKKFTQYLWPLFNNTGTDDFVHEARF